MEKNFEESIVELEGIVNELEKGQISLENSLILFEKGIKLVRECNHKLKCAQQKVEQLIVENGEMRTEQLEI